MDLLPTVGVGMDFIPFTIPGCRNRSGNATFSSLKMTVPSENFTDGAYELPGMP